MGLRMLVLFAAAHAGCTDGGGGGCGPPVGEKWDTWSMAASTYTYCYQGEKVSSDDTVRPTASPALCELRLFRGRAAKLLGQRRGLTV